MIDPAKLTSNPVLSFALRVAFGAYIVFLAREFYADPFGYFRRVARRTVELEWLAPVIRGMACFCLWGGCFIIATAIAVQIFGFHGNVLAVVLMVLAAIATWLLLPKQRPRGGATKDGTKSARSKEDRPNV
jgi:hypothetical protein